MDLQRLKKELNDTGKENPLFSLHGARPKKDEIIAWIKDLQALLFPGYFQPACGVLSDTDALLSDTAGRLSSLLEKSTLAPEKVLYTVDAFMDRLPAVKALLLKDVQAFYQGDPAAKNTEEVLLCYPGFFAIFIYRLAHELHLLSVPLLPRMMTEYAHEKTGVDIHPGATVGEYFFIDHATGIVVGETTVIGSHVKLYQGVTLGAKSFELDENGNPVKNIKRHPNIGNNVIIYANATILGGNTTVGDGCVIGASVWLTRSVPAGTTLYYTPNQKTSSDLE